MNERAALNRRVAQKAKVFLASVIKICGSPREEAESVNRKWCSEAEVTCPVLLNVDCQRKRKESGQRKACQRLLKTACGEVSVKTQEN